MSEDSSSGLTDGMAGIQTNYRDESSGSKRRHRARCGLKLKPKRAVLTHRRVSSRTQENIYLPRSTLATALGDGGSTDPEAIEAVNTFVDSLKGAPLLKLLRALCQPIESEAVADSQAYLAAMATEAGGTLPIAE